MTSIRSKATMGLLLVTTLVAALLISPPGHGPTPAAAAVYQITCSGGFNCATGGYGPQHLGWPDVYYGWNNGWPGFDGHNCTRYAAFKLQQNGLPNPGSSFGDAKSWDTSVAAKYGSDKVNNTPAVGAIAQYDSIPGDGGHGHVAYVEEVGADYIKITDDSYGGVTKARTIPRGDPTWWPSHFLHLTGTPTPPLGSPIGNVDSAVGLLGGGIFLTGWVLDPDARTTVTSIHAYIDGPAGSGARGVNLGSASFSRPDVAAAHPGSSAEHGFITGIMDVPPGRHTVYVYGINVSGTRGENVLLGQSTVTVPGASAGTPIGNGDAGQGSIGAIRTQGWAFDPDNPTAAVEIHAYVDGPAGTGARGVNLGRARTSRPDVGRVHPTAGPGHGFDAWVKGVPPGPHTLFVYAVNQSGAGDNPLIGIHPARVPSGSPVGSFDTIADRGGAILVRGWGIDPDAPTAAIGIHAYVDGPSGDPHARFVNRGSASLDRPDVGTVYPGAGSRHGFRAVIQGIPAGNHTVYLYALNKAAPGGNILLGSKSVSVSPAPDTTAPQTSVVSGPSGSHGSRTAEFTFRSSEAGSTFRCRLDDDRWRTCTSPHRYRGLPNGNHTFRVRARDKAGNLDRTPATRTFTIRQAKVTVKPSRDRTRLRIDVDPDRAGKDYTVKLQKRRSDGWRTKYTVQTRGTADRLRVDVPRGRWRAIVPAQHNMIGNKSNTTWIRR